MYMNGIFYEGDFRKTFLAHVLGEIHIDKIYDPVFVGKENLTVVDVGANVGLASLYFAKYASKVIAVEPTESHYKCLSEMVRYNNLQNVIPVNLAVGSKSELKLLHHSKNATMNSLSPLTNDTGETEMVKVVTLEDLFKEYKLNVIDFLKIDVEGSEMDLICSESFAKVAKQIRSLSVEYHTWTNRNVGQLVQALEKYGFNVSTLPTVADVYLATK